MSNKAPADMRPYPRLPLLGVAYLDELHESILHSPAEGGYDVWDLP